MKQKKVFIALKEKEEIESITSFFQLFGYQTIQIENLPKVTNEISSRDILIVDLYFNEVSVLQSHALPSEYKHKVFVMTPRALFEDEETYAQKADMHILKKPVNYDILYSRLLDQMGIQ